MANYTQQITCNGYRIYKDSELILVQEDQFANAFDGDTMEERAQNCIAQLTKADADFAEAEATKQPTLEQQVAAQAEAIAELSILIAGGIA